MTTAAPTLDLSGKKDWAGAFRALRRLLSDAGDTAQVFRIMRALNAGVAKAGYERLMATASGGRIAYRRVELAKCFSDSDFIEACPPGSVGSAYGIFLCSTGFSADGLVAASNSDDLTREAEHPYAWYGRLTRDVHDIWHILTGYPADDPLGEACLVAFSYAQTGGLGWAAIAVGAALKTLRSPAGLAGVRAIWEGYRNGRRATWLPGEDYEQLLSDSLDQARARLQIALPKHFGAALARRHEGH